jgi:hypothetical protein
VRFFGLFVPFIQRALHFSVRVSLFILFNGYKREECRLRVFENRILRRIFGPKRDANEESGRLHNEQLNSFYRSPDIVMVIKSRTLRQAGHIAIRGHP